MPTIIPQQCKDNQCIQKCCDYKGSCPTEASSCLYHYHYEEEDYSGVIFAAIYVGTIFGICILVCLCSYCCHKLCVWKRNRFQLPVVQANRIPGPLPSMIIANRDEPSYGTNSFQDLFMDENRRHSYPPPIGDPPVRANIPPYFRPNPALNDLNPYYNS